MNITARYPDVLARTGITSGFKNVISVDVEDYFHAESFADIVERSQWGMYPSRVENNTMRLLDLFAELKVDATFFVLGWVAERFPGLVREIAAGGHEVACHSYQHHVIYKMEPKGIPRRHVPGQADD